MQEANGLIKYYSPKILSKIVSPDITKCMQNTGGINERSTFNLYKKKKTEIEFAKLKKSSFIKYNSKIVPLILLLFFATIFMCPSILFSQLDTNKVTTIPILIPQSHPVINEIADGINKGFEELGYNEPKFLTSIKDVQGVQANISTMIDAAIQKRPPIIITITTGLSKTTVEKVSGLIPVVFSGVTDPVGAGIVNDLNIHGNVTGASDLWPVEDQLRLITKILPNVKSVGIVFKPSEPNSQYGINIARLAAEKLNIKIVERGVEDAKELVTVLEAILPIVDAIYIGPDNMTIESANSIVESAIQARIPVFGGEPGTLEKGAVGVVSINYFDHGRETAKLCDKILNNISANEIPVYVSDSGFIGLNYESAEKLNLAIPKKIRDEAKNTIGQYKEPKTYIENNSIVFILIAFCILIILFVFILLRKNKKT